MEFKIQKEHRNKSGVYIIRNSVDERFYVGGSYNLLTRFARHKRELKAGNHYNINLTKFVEEYGMECLRFELLELVSKEELSAREQVWLDKLEATTKGFNVSRTSVGAGYNHTPETKEKMREAHTGKIISEEQREKQRQKRLGMKMPREWVEKSANSRRGKKHSEERKRKAAEGFKNALNKSPELLDKIRANAAKARAAKPKFDSEETKRKKSLALTGRPVSAETRKKIAAAQKGIQRVPRKENQCKFCKAIFYTNKVRIHCSVSCAGKSKRKAN